MKEEKKTTNAPEFSGFLQVGCPVALGDFHSLLIVREGVIEVVQRGLAQRACEEFVEDEPDVLGNLDVHIPVRYPLIPQLLVCLDAPSPDAHHRRP